VVGFFREVRGATFASSALMEPITTAFVKALERFAQTEGVPLLTFAQGQRKDEVAHEYLATFQGHEGVLFIGKAQEKATVWRTAGFRYDVSILQAEFALTQVLDRPVTGRLLCEEIIYCLMPNGFASKDVRAHLAPLLGLDPSHLTPGRLTYDLRRLRLHGLIARIPHTQRYRVTREGLRTALFFTRVYGRILQPGMARITPPLPQATLRYVPPSIRWRVPSTAGLTRPNSPRKRDSFAPYVPPLGV